MYVLLFEPIFPYNIYFSREVPASRTGPPRGPHAARGPRAAGWSPLLYGNNCNWIITWSDSYTYQGAESYHYTGCPHKKYTEKNLYNGKTTLYMEKRNISLERAECPLCNGIQLVMLLTQMSDKLDRC